MECLSIYKCEIPLAPSRAPCKFQGRRRGLCAGRAQGCMQDAPRACPVCPALLDFMNCLGASQKASHNWDKGLASVFYVKHAAPLPISALPGPRVNPRVSGSGVRPPAPEIMEFSVSNSIKKLS